MSTNLKLLSNTMKDWSSTAGDHHWQAHIAIEELIRLRDRDENAAECLQELLKQVDDAFTTQIKTKPIHEKLNAQLSDLFLKIGLIRLKATEALRVIGVRKPRIGEYHDSRSELDKQNFYSVLTGSGNVSEQIRDKEEFK